MNINIQRLLHSNISKYIISILLGLGLSSLFRKACKSRNCLIFKGPPINKLKNQIFNHNNKCYKFTETSINCSNNSDNNKKRQIEFELEKIEE